MRIAIAYVLVGLVLSPIAVLAQDDLTSDQLRRMYEDALSQLKSAQDRRSELARENENLRAQITELEQKVRELQEQLDTIADVTLRVRSERAAWDAFLEAEPAIRRIWLGFLHENTLPRLDYRTVLDSNWPFYAIRP